VRAISRVIAAAFLVAAATAGAQAPAVPCKGLPCSLVIDWGVGKAVNDMPPDRRFGSPEDFDKALRAALAGHEMIASSATGAVSIRVQATYKTRVLCDDMPGTAPDRSCATIGEAIANFGSDDKALALSSAVRMINRCGASEAVMSMKQFGAFVGEMIWYSLEGAKQAAKKPSGKC
jgi:hypothetical protein